MNEITLIESPCVNVCQLDPRSGLCMGCARTLDEIARWSGMSVAERRRVMSELDGRRAASAMADPTKTTG